MRDRVEQRIRNGSELAFLLHGLEFARIRTGFAGNTFNPAQEITFSVSANKLLSLPKTKPTSVTS